MQNLLRADPNFKSSTPAPEEAFIGTLGLGRWPEFHVYPHGT